jgi:Fur family transcriptional regulator, ferric uptake regulator
MASVRGSANLPKTNHEPKVDGEPVTRRQTRQRSLIWDVLVQANGAHLSVAEVQIAVTALGSPLHRATIYRTLDRLVDDGLVVRTDLGSDRDQYEIGHHHHHHVVCAGCGHVEHVRHHTVERAIRRIEDDSGFDLTDAGLSLSGRCRSCQAG